VNYPGCCVTVDGGWVMVASVEEISAVVVVVVVVEGND